RGSARAAGRRRQTRPGRQLPLGAMSRKRFAIAALALIACGAPPPKPAASPAIGDWTFDVDASKSPLVSITAVFRKAQSTRFVLGIVPKSLEIQQNGQWIALAPKDDF